MARGMMCVIAALVALVSCASVRPVVAIDCTVPAQNAGLYADDLGTVRSAMLASYDKYTPPIPGSATTITAATSLYSLNAVNEATGTIEVVTTLELEWIDRRLVYYTQTTTPAGCLKAPGMYLDDETSDLLWRPRYKTANLHETTDLESTEVTITPTGKVGYSTRQVLVTSCEFDFQRMPFDTQTCGIRLQMLSPSGMAAFNTTEKSFVLDPDGIGGTKAWTLSDFTVKNGNAVDGRGYIDFEFNLVRIPDYWVVFTIAPSVLLVFMSYGTFWIQRSAMPARATFGFICYLTMISLTNGALAVLPKISPKHVFLLNLLTLGQFFCAFTVFEVVIANYFLHIEFRVAEAWKEARNEANYDELVESGSAMDFIGPRISKLDHYVVNKHGKMYFSDQHVDVLARWLFPVAYGIAVAALCS